METTRVLRLNLLGIYSKGGAVYFDDFSERATFGRASRKLEPELATAEAHDPQGHQHILNERSEVRSD